MHILASLSSSAKRAAWNRTISRYSNDDLRSSSRQSGSAECSFHVSQDSQRPAGRREHFVKPVPSVVLQRWSHLLGACSKCRQSILFVGHATPCSCTLHASLVHFIAIDDSLKIYETVRFPASTVIRLMKVSAVDSHAFFVVAVQ